MKHDLDAHLPVIPIASDDVTTFTVTTVDGRKTFINGTDIKDIFHKIDGLRLEGKRWLETYDFFLADQVHRIFINIDHIISIE